MKGSRTAPNIEMLAAPRKKAVHILTGGPGRSPAATTSHRMSSAGATAAVPMTVGRDSRTSISIALFEFPPYLGGGACAMACTCVGQQDFSEAGFRPLPSANRPIEMANKLFSGAIHV